MALKNLHFGVNIVIVLQRQKTDSSKIDTDKKYDGILWDELTS